MNIRSHLTNCVFLSCVLLSLTFATLAVQAQEVPRGTIDRKAVVSRHNLTLKDSQFAGPTQVGNGSFAYGFDITGMQTFSDQFTTMSHWGWHSTEPPNGFTADSFKQTLVDTHGRMIGYDLPDPKQAALTQWLASNPHRFNLGRIGLLLKKQDGTSAEISDLRNPVQYLDLWTGVAESIFTIEGQNIKVTTICDPDKDIISFKIESSLIQKGRIGVFVEFPYASLKYFSTGSDYNKPLLHETNLKRVNANSVIFDRRLDRTIYHVACNWSGRGKIEKQKKTSL